MYKFFLCINNPWKSNPTGNGIHKENILFKNLYLLISINLF
jgi:hypothetical protein